MTVTTISSKPLASRLSNGAALLSSWNAVRVGSDVTAMDIVLLGLAGLLAVSQQNEVSTVRQRLILRAAVVALIVMAGALASILIRGGAVGPLSEVARLLVATLLVPLVLSGKDEFGDRCERLLTNFSIGVAISSVVALAQAAGVVGALFGVPEFDGRYPGLTVHPNHLAVACALAVPIGVVHLARHRQAGSMMWLLVPITIGGLLVSGSRGGLIAAGAGVLVVFLGTDRKGRSLARAGLVILALIGAVIVLGGAPSRASDTQNAFARLFKEGTSSEMAEASNQKRSSLLVAEIKRFGESPIVGPGYENIRVAHSVPMQLLASGGLLLGVVMLWWFLPLVRGGLRFGESSGLRGALVALLISSLVENLILDRFLYVIFGAAVAAVSAEARRGRGRSVVTQNHPRPPTATSWETRL